MKPIASPEVTKSIMHRYGLRAVKKLGQNFLADAGIAEKIAEAAELTEKDTVLEIGPGLGSLTEALAETGAKVIAVELDGRMIPILSAGLKGYGNVRIVQGDILKMDILKETGGRPFKVCANLPYYITTPVIFALLEKNLPMERLVITVQKEVVRRMAAAPGGRNYGVLSVAARYFTEPEILLTVPKEAFIPAPKVESAVIMCRKREKPPVSVCDEGLFFRVVKAAFSVRRKMLVNALKNMGITGDECAAWLFRAGIDGKRRGETLSLEDFASLANTFGG